MLLHKLLTFIYGVGDAKSTVGTFYRKPGQETGQGGLYHEVKPEYE